MPCAAAKGGNRVQSTGVMEVSPLVSRLLKEECAPEVPALRLLAMRSFLDLADSS